MLNRKQIDDTSKQLAANAPKRGGGILGGIKNSLAGDDTREEAARRILESTASQEAGKGETVVVVIGSDDDRTKVKESLAGVERDVLLLFVDDSVSDNATDNGALHGGLAGKVKGSATNLWVYLPSSGNSASRKPNQTLSVKVASPKLWTGVLASAGDLPAQASSSLNRVGTSRSGAASSTASPSSTPSPSPASAPTPAPGSTSASASPARGAVAPGDVLVAKIAGVKMVAQPADNAKAVATLGKGDEVVATGTESNGFVPVQGAGGSGWVNLLMMNRQP